MAFLPGQKAKSAGGTKLHKNGSRKPKIYKSLSRWGDHDVDPAFGAEYTTTSKVSGSRYWQPKVDERDDFGQVTVYDADGNVTRVIPKEALTRPWRAKDGAKWSIRL